MSKPNKKLSILVVITTIASLPSLMGFYYNLGAFWKTKSTVTAGSLDTTYDSDGMVTNDIGSSDNRGKGMAIQSDDKLILVGYTTNTDQDSVVSRFNTDGSYDTSFATNGVYEANLADLADTDYPQAAAIQTDGKIVVGGIGSISGSANSLIARFTSSGALDTTFSTDGKHNFSFSGVAGNSGEIRSIALQLDGKIVVCGSVYTGGSDQFAFARFNSDGSLDTSFDSDGLVLTDIIASAEDICWSVAIQADGKIVGAGHASNGANGNDFAVVRYNTDGSLDTSFDSDGKVLVDFAGGSDIGRGVAIQSWDQKIVVGGKAEGTNGDFGAIRLNTDGSLDTSFDTDGRVSVSLDSGNDNPYGIALQTNGKIVLGGYKAGTNSMAAVRFNTDGSLDTTFDSDGIATCSPGANDWGDAGVVIQSDGKIIVAGRSWQTDNDLAICRFEPGENL